MAEPLWRPHLATPEDDLQPLSASRLERDPPARDWMVEGCFMKGTVGLIAGDGGIGKSLVCQQLATAAALGRPWLGLEVQSGRSLYLGCEDDGDELHRRQWAINRDVGCAMSDALDAGLELFARVGSDNTLMALDRPSWRMKRTQLMDRLVAHCCTAGIQYVILDTATKVFAGNQNDEKQVSDFIAEMRRLAIAIQGIVLLTKHPSASGRANGSGESGSVQWENSVRARLYLNNHKALGLVLNGMKSNYSRKLDPLPLEWRRGVFVRREPELPRDSVAEAYR